MLIRPYTRTVPITVTVPAHMTFSDPTYGYGYGKVYGTVNIRPYPYTMSFIIVLNVRAIGGDFTGGSNGAGTTGMTNNPTTTERCAGRASTDSQSEQRANPLLYAWLYTKQSQGGYAKGSLLMPHHARGRIGATGARGMPQSWRPHGDGAEKMERVQEGYVRGWTEWALAIECRPTECAQPGHGRELPKGLGHSELRSESKRAVSHSQVEPSERLAEWNPNGESRIRGRVAR
ncbi:hypothetical protein GGX14DRAFT_384240 [Mycena pura]|uniref:Uncharacterized protein n=1 Tax=Mycena pura TaxID=153505 RepID=A0AAD6YVE0_9AGAR|nr:hypothetical protein GGX14DRAFT_384240 [Mycena pura]